MYAGKVQHGKSIIRITHHNQIIYITRVAGGRWFRATKSTLLKRRGTNCDNQLVVVYCISTSNVNVIEHFGV